MKPLLLFGVIYLVFSLFMESPVEKYPIYLLLGILIWNFFSESTLIGMNALLTKRELITKIYFPRVIVIVASTLSSLITLGLNFMIFFIFLIFSGELPTLQWLFFLLYVCELYLISTGIAFLLATAYVKFRDLQHIWEVLLQIGFWLTPIIYPVSIVPAQYHRFIFLNPLARIIEYSRDIFLKNHISSLFLNLILLFMTLIIFFGGYYVFKKAEMRMPEKI